MLFLCGAGLLPVKEGEKEKPPGGARGFFFPIQLWRGRGRMYGFAKLLAAGGDLLFAYACSQYRFRLQRPTLIAVSAGSMPSNSMAMVSS